MDSAEETAAQLPCWLGPVRPIRLKGGISNENFLVDDHGRKFVVKINGDVPEHGVWRANDIVCNRAAAGVAPEVHHSEAEAIVVAYVNGRTLNVADVRDDGNLARFLTIVRRTHNDAYREIRGPVCGFWPFRVCRGYALFLDQNGGRMKGEVDRLRAANEQLEKIVGPVDMVLGHNDLLAANLIDDGEHLWLIDWEHAGLTSPLFDLANLSSNNVLSNSQERWFLETYFERTADEQLLRRFQAMKCSSLLREAMWNMVSELTSTLDFDYVAYPDQFLGRFEGQFGRL